MISRIEANGYRCLRYVSQEVSSFQILVGPNASGKTTFLDVPGLIGSMLEVGLDAVADRSSDLRDLVWMGKSDHFELAVELAIPEEKRGRNGHERTRYELAIGYDTKDELAILAENLWLIPKEPNKHPAFHQSDLFPRVRSTPDSIVAQDRKKSLPGWKKVVSKKSSSANDYFFSEKTKWNAPFRFGPRKLALANLPEDEERFPIGTWAKNVLRNQVQRVVLNSEMMRESAPPGSPREFQVDGSSLPWAIEELREKNPARFQEWLDHVKTALPDIEAIDTVQREDDKHRYLRVQYRSGHRAPSWTLSDGTLRLLALTLVAYLDLPERTYLVEEPENGIHPAAVESVYQALSSTYECQILCASHSPIVLSLADPSQLLCFAKTDEGGTDVVVGDQHPKLQNWRRDADLGTLFAAGVLG